MSDELKKLTDWTRFKSLLNQPRAETNGSPVVFFPFTKLESSLNKEFPAQHEKIENFIKNFKEVWPELSRENLHLDLNLRNSYYSKKFLNVVREEMSKFSQDAFCLHAEKIKNPDEIVETLAEIKRSVPLQNSWLRIIFITQANTLEAADRETLNAYFKNEQSLKKHLILWISESESEGTVHSPAPALSMSFDSPGEDAIAEIMLSELISYANAYGCKLNYVEPELLAFLMSEIKRLSVGSELPIFAVIEQNCLGVLMAAREDKIKLLSLAMSWTGEITLLSEPLKKIA